jgi:hypothetical protein
MEADNLPHHIPESGQHIQQNGHIIQKLESRSKLHNGVTDRNGNDNHSHIVAVDGTMSPASLRPETPNSTTRKSAWERARDKYKQQEVECSKKKTKVKPFVDPDDRLEQKKCFSFGSIKQIFQSSHFKNVDLELLYQRYFFKLNQLNLCILMGFICVLCVILSVTYYVNGATLPARAVNFGILFLLCIFLEYICNRSSFDQQHMFISSFIIIVFFFGSLSLISLDSSPKSGSDGVWTTVVFIYMVYTLLPIRMRLACLAGFLLSVINISCMIKFTMHEDFVIKQVSIIIVHCDSFQLFS